MAAVVANYRRPLAPRIASGLGIYALAALVAIWLMGPFLWLFITSISYQRDLMAMPTPLLPVNPTLENYQKILGLTEFDHADQARLVIASLSNSFIVAFAVTAINIVFGSAAGYAYARHRSRAMSLSLYLVLFTRMLPVVVLIPALFLMLRQVGLQNSLTGLTIAYCSFTFPFTIWIMKSYFETIPRELEESGLVDGCTRFQVFVKLIVPISGPGFVAAGAFTFVLAWNEFLVAQVLNSKRGMTTLPPAIAGMLGQANIDYAIIAASGFISALPAALLALIFQRYMVQGLTAGSVKS
ncbi:carbohydrate ABC transporter permease [Arvimicrobium flavum]|uniref:carbohydrate ABC transporter permease n=1 Tax=Arvimicrobium flavum TaxID=3393320 RepID=UPI00237BFE4E|nr:carbohydrate ABC transporter permease [Mesorhizobium shangrilense]